MQVTKHIEKVKIFTHYTNYKGRLFVKTLCDLFNDVAEVQTKYYGVDVDTLNAAGATWMLHRLHIRLNKMPSENEEVFIETWPQVLSVFLPPAITVWCVRMAKSWYVPLPNGCISI